MNITISFGVKPGESPFGGVGAVYVDTNKGGEIYDYYDVPNSLSPLIRHELDIMDKKEGTYWLHSNNCRHFTTRMIDYLVKKYNLKKIAAPKRILTPPGELPGGSSSAPTTNSGVWTTSPGPTSQPTLR